MERIKEFLEFLPKDKSISTMSNSELNSYINQFVKSKQLSLSEGIKAKIEIMRYINSQKPPKDFQYQIGDYIEYDQIGYETQFKKEFDNKTIIYDKGLIYDVIEKDGIQTLEINFPSAPIPLEHEKDRATMTRPYKNTDPYLKLIIRPIYKEAALEKWGELYADGFSMDDYIKFENFLEEQIIFAEKKKASVLPIEVKKKEVKEPMTKPEAKPIVRKPKANIPRNEDVENKPISTLEMDAVSYIESKIKESNKTLLKEMDGYKTLLLDIEKNDSNHLKPRCFDRIVIYPSKDQVDLVKKFIDKRNEKIHLNSIENLTMIIEPYKKEFFSALEKGEFIDHRILLENYHYFQTILKSNEVIEKMSIYFIKYPYYFFDLIFRIYSDRYTIKDNGDETFIIIFTRYITAYSSNSKEIDLDHYQSILITIMSEHFNSPPLKRIFLKMKRGDQFAFLLTKDQMLIFWEMVHKRPPNFILDEDDLTHIQGEIQYDNFFLWKGTD